MRHEPLLAIKVVPPQVQHDFRWDEGGGSNKDPFVEVTPALRKGFAKDLHQVQNFFARSFADQPNVPAVAKVTLRPEATAKSYRPTKLFDEQSCPIIGVDEPGQFYISVKSDGLQRLERRILNDNRKIAQKNISTITKIEPFTEEDALSDQNRDEILKARRKDVPLRLQLFRHASSAVNRSIDEAFNKLLERYPSASATPLEYADELKVVALHNATPAAITGVLGFAGTQRLSVFPNYKTVRIQSHVAGILNAENFPPPKSRGDYGIVGLIDSGTDPNNRALQAWVDKRVQIVDATDQDHEHGSFVAGLVTNSRALNHGDNGFPSAACRIVDVVALDKNGEISEYDLLGAIEKALKESRHVRVWNLSLAQSDCTCKNKRFSLLAMRLDSLARKYNVLFVVSAGNFTEEPLRSWPPDVDLEERDRICPPADSIRALTVGSVAHLETNASRVRKGDPSPFTRRGPGPHFYIKPELSHNGGNCDSSLQCLQTGIVSLDNKGRLIEAVGTSFSCPLVATIAGSVFRELEVPKANISPTLVKALLIHSAFLKSVPLKKFDVDYRGIGAPGDVQEVVSCREPSATIVMQVPLLERQIFEKKDFPIPQCLMVPKKGLRAEIFMTLLYDPPTNGRYGMEYCRTNVTASLGIEGIDKKTGKPRHKKLIPNVPTDLEEGREENLVREGYKWSPLKLYYRKFNGGFRRKKWKLALETLNRSGYHSDEPINTVVLITIRDPEWNAFVYQGLVRQMTHLGWGAQDIQTKARVRSNRA